MNHHSSNTNMAGFDDSDEDVNLMTQWPMTIEDESEEISSMDSTTCALSKTTSLRNITAMKDSSVSHVILDHSYCSPSLHDNEQASTHVTRKVASIYIGSSSLSNQCILALILFRDVTITMCLR